MTRFSKLGYFERKAWSVGMDAKNNHKATHLWVSFWKISEFLRQWKQEKVLICPCALTKKLSLLNNCKSLQWTALFVN
jgi:hypothetical protein